MKIYRTRTVKLRAVKKNKNKNNEAEKLHKRAVSNQNKKGNRKIDKCSLNGNKGETVGVAGTPCYRPVPGE